jgi:hypothetical protein
MPHLQFNEKLELQKTHTQTHTHTHTLSHQMFGLHNVKDVHCCVLICMFRSKSMD